MPDKWGRPTMEDGWNMVRSFMAIKGFQDKQRDRAEKIQDRKDFQTATGMSPGAYRGKMAVTNLSKLDEDKKMLEAKKTIGAMPDADVLKYTPVTYQEHVALADRMKRISENSTYRANIDKINNAQAMESYQLSQEAFNEATQKYQNGDLQGASQELANIGKVTNNVYKWRPNPDGKTGEVYWTKDGVDQPGQTMPIEQAMQVVQEHLSSDVFFREHLMNREARKKLNYDEIKKPKILSNGKKTLMAVRQLGLNDNHVNWSIYDDKGHIVKRTDDIQDMFQDGWRFYDTKSVKEALGITKLKTDITKNQSADKEKMLHSIAKRIDEAEKKASNIRAGIGSYVPNKNKSKLAIKWEKEAVRLRKRFKSLGGDPSLLFGGTNITGNGSNDPLGIR